MKFNRNKVNDKDDVPESERVVKVDTPEKYRDVISEAQVRKTLFKKQKELVGKSERLVDFKEPVAILMRRTGAGEWVEDVKKGKFYFQHSDGEKRFIIITGKPQDMGYAGRTFKMYILHEDFPLPLPENPLLTTETVGMMLEQALISSNKLRAEEWRGKTNFVKMLVIGIAVIGLIILLWTVLAPTPVSVPAPTPAEIISNVTGAPAPTVLG